MSADHQVEKQRELLQPSELAQQHHVRLDLRALRSVQRIRHAPFVRRPHTVPRHQCAARVAHGAAATA